MKISNYFIFIKVIVLFSLIPFQSFSQDREEIQIFFNEFSHQILSLAHKNSTFISSDVQVVDSDESDFEYKVIISISYKGLINNHILKCYTYIEDFPRRFVWGTDTNTFDFNNSPETVLEELKEKWSKYKFD